MTLAVGVADVVAVLPSFGDTVLVARETLADFVGVGHAAIAWCHIGGRVDRTRDELGLRLSLRQPGCGDAVGFGVYGCAGGGVADIGR